MARRKAPEARIAPFFGIELSFLHAFQALALALENKEAMSFGRLAKEFGSPASAFRAIRAVEAKLGKPLVNRNSRPWQLTSFGERFRGYAEQ